MSITRRRLLAASGTGVAAAGAAAALGACGADEEEPSAERDVELLQRALNAEATLVEIYRLAQDQALGGAVSVAVEAFGEQAAEHERRLTAQIEDVGGTPAAPEAEPPAGESVVEAIR